MTRKLGAVARLAEHILRNDSERHLNHLNALDLSRLRVPFTSISQVGGL